MSKETTVTQDAKVLAALAHGSILLGIFTSGMGGIVAALVIWLVQKEKSAYVAFQALQSLVYQVVTFLVTMVVWCCWGLLLTGVMLVPLFGNPDAYENTATVPVGFWLAMASIVIPFGIWGLTILYGLWGALRCLGGYDFKYAIVGKWLETQE
jgi:uncharacterized Tic20 family protein